MKDSTRNALALFVFALVMVSLSPIFSNLLSYDALFSILPYFELFLNLEILRWGTVSIGLIAALLGILTVLFNLKRK